MIEKLKADQRRERKNAKRRNDSIKAKVMNPIIRRELISKGLLFTDGKIINDDCPESDDGKCPECGSWLELGYGFAGGYGLGAYSFCIMHGYFDFSEDLG